MLYAYVGVVDYVRMYRCNPYMHVLCIYIHIYNVNACCVYDICMYGSGIVVILAELIVSCMVLMTLIRFVELYHLCMFICDHI